MTLQPAALVLSPWAPSAQWLHHTAHFLTDAAPAAAHDLLLPRHVSHQEQHALQMDSAACTDVNKEKE